MVLRFKVTAPPAPIVEGVITTVTERQIYRITTNIAGDAFSERD